MNNRDETELRIAAERAALPFALLEELKIPCGYERSFKLLPGKLLANRYLLGVDLKNIHPAQLHAVCQRMNMPDEFIQSLNEHLSQANLVFLGFEDNPPDGTYKVYLEFWDRVKFEIQSESASLESKLLEPQLLHLGFKWNVADNSQRTISRYLCYPLLSTDVILQRMTEVYAEHTTAPSLNIATEIMAFAAGRVAEGSIIYMEVVEDGSPRRSFDINLYSAMLPLQDIKPALLRLREHFEIPINSFDRLLHLTCDKSLGHLSGGINQHGEEFLTIYYEV